MTTSRYPNDRRGRHFERFPTSAIPAPQSRHAPTEPSPRATYASGMSTGAFQHERQSTSSAAERQRRLDARDDVDFSLRLDANVTEASASEQSDRHLPISQ